MIVHAGEVTPCVGWRLMDVCRVGEHDNGASQTEIDRLLDAGEDAGYQQSPSNLEDVEVAQEAGSFVLTAPEVMSTRATDVFACVV